MIILIHIKMFAELSKSPKNKRQEFLEEMEKVMPWDLIKKEISPYYNKERPNGGRKKMDVLVMIKIKFLQEWFGLSDPAVESEIYDSVSMQNFLGLKLTDPIPDETTILHFRHFLEAHKLGEKLLKTSLVLFEEKGLYMKKGTIVDATILKASSSTKNKTGKRDPEMSSTRKNNNYYFGMKMHIGSDSESGIVHTVKGTTAKTSDKSQLYNCLHGEEKALFADKGYIGQEDKRNCRKNGVFWGVLDKVSVKRNKKLSSSQKKRNKKLSSVRAKVEHFFSIKILWRCAKVRYRGIFKNTESWNIKAFLYNFRKYRYMFYSTR